MVEVATKVSQNNQSESMHIATFAHASWWPWQKLGRSGLLSPSFYSLRLTHEILIVMLMRAF